MMGEATPTTSDPSSSIICHLCGNRDFLNPIPSFKLICKTTTGSWSTGITQWRPPLHNWDSIDFSILTLLLPAAAAASAATNRSTTRNCAPNIFSKFTSRTIHDIRFPDPIPRPCRLLPDGCGDRSGRHRQPKEMPDAAAASRAASGPHQQLQQQHHLAVSAASLAPLDAMPTGALAFQVADNIRILAEASAGRRVIRHFTADARFADGPDQRFSLPAECQRNAEGGFVRDETATFRRPAVVSVGASLPRVVPLARSSPSVVTVDHGIVFVHTVCIRSELQKF